MTTPTTTPATLTDRYIEAVLRRLPFHQRPDIERELRASIADAIVFAVYMPAQEPGPGIAVDSSSASSRSSILPAA